MNNPSLTDFLRSLLNRSAREAEQRSTWFCANCLGDFLEEQPRVLYDGSLLCDNCHDLLTQYVPDYEIGK